MKITCPSCKKTLKTQQANIGKVCKCSACNHKFTIKPLEELIAQDMLENDSYNIVNEPEIKHPQETNRSVAKEIPHKVEPEKPVRAREDFDFIDSPRIVPRLPWYYQMLRVLAYLWLVISVAPGTLMLVFTIVLFVLTLVGVVSGNDIENKKLGLVGVGMSGVFGVLWSFFVIMIGLFSSIWALAALVLCDIGETAIRTKRR